MTRIPERKQSPIAGPSGNVQRPRMPAPPNAAFAKPVEKVDLPLSVGDWLLTLIVLAVPVLNLILYVYWAFFSKGNRGRINFCRASLILAAVGLFIFQVVRVVQKGSMG